MDIIPYSDIQFIDIDSVLEKRNPGLKDKLPTFLINYIKKIAHQDDINAFLHLHGTKMRIDFVNAIVDYFQLKIKVSGLDNLPKDKSKKVIFVANHPLGGIDGAAFINEVSKIYPDIRTVINDILLNIKNMEGVFVGVNSFGNNKRHHLQAINKMFESNAQILLFPSGLVSRRKRGIIKDWEWKKTFVDWSRKYKRDVIPVHISGRVSSFFYNLANLRTALGIKANIEMFYLADEMFKNRDKEINISIGKAIPHTLFEREIKSAVWADEIRKFIYKLPGNTSIHFNNSII